MDPFCHGGYQIVHKFLPVAAAAQHIRTQLPDSFCCVLGIAAADRNDRVGIVTAAPPDHRPVLLVRHRGNRAGIDHIAVANFVKMSDFVAHIRQKTLHGLGFVLICLAAEGIKTKFHY